MKTLPERIDEALAGKPMPYYSLAHELYDGRTRAWNCASGGGPPGCFMALSAGLRRGGFRISHTDRLTVNAHAIVYPRTAKLTQTEEREFERVRQQLSKRTRKQVQAIRDSERLSAADYAVTINAR